MDRRSLPLLLFCAVLVLAFAWTATAWPAEASPAEGAPAQDPGAASSGAAVVADTGWGRMPLCFIENQGRFGPAVAYYVQGGDKSLYFTPSGMTFALVGDGSRWAVGLDFVGSSAVTPVGEGVAGTVVSHFTGSPDEWQTGLATYSSIVYRDVWPGVDVRYSGTADRLKQEFVLEPGADPDRIRLAYSGADVTLNEAGALVISTPAGGFVDDAPVAYQERDGVRLPVEVAFAPQPASAGDPGAFQYGFRLGGYDPALPLVIDPIVLVYCGYIGGTGDDSGEGIAVDASGNAYVVGYAASSEASFPEKTGPDLTYAGGYDAFIAKVNVLGTGFVYCGYIGGTGGDRAYDVAVDGNGNAYVTGYTSSSSGFPVLNGPDPSYNGGIDAFVTKVNAAGTGLVYSGFLGGTASDYGYGVAVDASGNAYITGYTQSTQTSFPLKATLDIIQNGGADAFVTKLNNSGALVYSGYVGGSGYDCGEDIAVNAAGEAYICGETSSNQLTFPEKGGPDVFYNGGNFDAFVAKVNSAGTALVYAGYVGGSGEDRALDIAVDSAGAPYLAGYTSSTQGTFPVKVGPDPTYNGGSFDAFVAKVDPAGTGLIYAGYVGGNVDDRARGVALDSSANVYLTGETTSSESSFPEIAGPDLTYNSPGYYDAFVAKVAAGGTAISYAGYVGGSGHDYGRDIAVDAGGNAYVTGLAGSSQATFPVWLGPDVTFGGGGPPDAFVAKVKNLSRPVVTSLSPNVGPNGGSTKVVITGTGFYGVYGATAVRFGGVNATSYVVNSGTSITAVAPAHSAGRVDVVVTNPAGSSLTGATGDDFTYLNRYQESDSRLYYPSLWPTSLKSMDYSGGFIRTRSSPGAMAFKFSGTGFRIVCAKGAGYGKLRVVVDGVAISSSLYPDLYSAVPAYKVVVYTRTGMANAQHVVQLDYSGLGNPSASAYTVNLDAIDIYGTLSTMP